MSTAAKSSAPGRRVITFDVFVENLPPDADQKKVGKMFSKYGEVHGIWISNSSDGNKFAIVKFYCEEDSIKAIEDTNGKIFEGGKPISCKKALKRNTSKKDGEQESQDKEDSTNANKEPAQSTTPPIKQRNPDIVPSFENNSSSSNIGAFNAGQGKKDKEKVFISHVETPIVIWGQRMLVDNADDLANISEQLALICPESPTITGKPDQEKIYGAKYSEDEQWYRCTIRYIFSHDRVKVQYIDFGNTEEINPSTLVELPKSLTALPTCAMKYMLHSCWCNSNQDQAGINYLKEMVEGNEVEIYQTARLSDHTGFYAKVFVDGMNVGDRMIESGHAFKKPGLEARGVRARMNMGGAGDAVPGLNQKINSIATGKDGPRKMEGGMGEKDDLANLKWKLKSLQMENSIMSNKLQENNLSVQLRDIKTLVCRVRKLRNQFPLDVETPLDLAIELVESPGKISMGMTESLPSLMKTIETYKQTQDTILKSEESALEDLINSRNAARKVLEQELTVTIEELKKVPLQDRGEKVQDVVAALSKHYDYFMRMGALNPTPLDKLTPAFEEWKAKKVEVRDTRRMCDTMESTVNSVIDKLKMELSLDPDQEEMEPNEDLTTCLKNYAKALQQEIAVSDTENGPDSILIGSLVQALLREMKEEASCVEHLGSVVKELTNLLESITPWLESTPSLDKLQEVRSKLKGLKSKLRHKLADKVDAEENQEMEELESIAQDLVNIRKKLHDVLIEEDNIMDEMSLLANAHFPELLHSNSDLGFKLNLIYKGLVKMSYAPEHFTMTSVGDGSSGIYTSQFAGEDVLIKEYFLNIGKHLGKDDFLHQLAVYSSASSPFLESIKAVFFDKSNRQAYVLIKKQGELLSELVTQSDVSKEKCKSVIGCLSQGLDVLNRLNIIHGQVKPEFVTVIEDGMAQLLPPDFSLTTIERCNYRFLPNRGLEMIAPELRHQRLQTDPNHFTDIYYLGLLALWMHHPNANFLLRKDGAVDFGHLSLDRDFGIFLTKLLAPNPHFRPPANVTLHLEYLNQGESNVSMPSKMGDQDYEAIRKRNIEDNRRVLASFGLPDPGIPGIVKKGQKKAPKADKPKKRPAPSYFDSIDGGSVYGLQRKSARLRGKEAGSDPDYLPRELKDEDEENVIPKVPSNRPNFYGSIPGIDVGTMWATRLECCRDGIHRPTVAGIHGGEDGAYSIALSGGYEDDIDLGECFTYTGEGGRDLKGTKANPKNLRTAPQSKDQALIRGNLALSKNVDTRNPVRVIRGYKLDSPFAPEDGYRYDGLYSVEKCWFTTGLSGFGVWKFALKRLSDQASPPWQLLD